MLLLFPFFTWQILGAGLTSPSSEGENCSPKRKQDLCSVTHQISGIPEIPGPISTSRLSPPHRATRHVLYAFVLAHSTQWKTPQSCVLCALPLARKELGVVFASKHKTESNRNWAGRQGRRWSLASEMRASHHLGRSTLGFLAAEA